MAKAMSRSQLIAKIAGKASLSKKAAGEILDSSQSGIQRHIIIEELLMANEEITRRPSQPCR